MAEIAFHKERDYFVPDLYLEKEEYENDYIIGKYGFGAGGRGTEITDSCTKPYGEWSVNRVYYDGIDKSDYQNWPQEPCNGVSTSSAESGSPGVIIISW